MTKRVLLLKPGVTSSKVVLGDYEVWFSAAGGAQMTPVELHAGERPPSVEGFDAVIMTGSPLSVTAPVQWMERAADYLVEAAETKPVLRVCFGHQLLAWRHGAQVVRNPKGRELGTVFVELTAAGKQCSLLVALPERFDIRSRSRTTTESRESSRVLLTRTRFRSAFGAASTRPICRRRRTNSRRGKSSKRSMRRSWLR